MKDEPKEMQEPEKTPLANAVAQLRARPDAEQTARNLLAQSRAEYGQLCITYDTVAKRKEEVRQHIAALETLLEQVRPSA